MDPMNLATGRLPVTATGLLTTSNGVGRFQLESASLGPVPIPKVLLQEIVGFYSRTPENPAGIGLDDPFALPARIREIQVEPGRADSRAVTAEPARDAPAVPQGRRSSSRRRSRARRAPHRRRPAVPVSHPLRRSQPPSADCVAAARPDRVNRRPGLELRLAIDPASRLQDFRGARHRPQRLDSGDVAEPAVPARRVFARAAGRPVRPRRDARGRRSAADQSAVRAPRRRRWRDGAHRPDRAGLREDRQRHREDPAQAGATTPSSSCPRTWPIRCRTPSGCGSTCRLDERHCSRRIFRPTGRRSI